MAAILRGVEAGADWIEIDVQETADGEVVVFHDSDFKRVGGRPLVIWEARSGQLADIDMIQATPWQGVGRAGKFLTSPFKSPIDDFYRTDPISRASPTMAECSELHTPSAKGTGTDG